MHYNLMRRHKHPDAGWCIHGAFRKRPNAEKLMRAMERDKLFQEYRIDESHDASEKHFMDEAVEQLM